MKAKTIATDEKELRDQVEVSRQDEEEEEFPVANVFRWTNRVGCIEAIALEYVDNGGKYDTALRTVRLREYAFNVTKMLVKQKNQLRRDVVKRAKDIQHMRDSAKVGDIVRVPKLIPNPLLGDTSATATSSSKPKSSPSLRCPHQSAIPSSGYKMEVFKSATVI